MKILSIIPEDSTVVIDGIGLFFDFIIDSAIHAVQWSEDALSGHIEYNDGRINKEIYDINQFQSILSLYHLEAAEIAEEKHIVDEAIATEQVKREAFEATYGYKRQKAYPAIGEQLDMLWHSMDSGEIAKSSEFYNALKVVKDEFPVS